MYVYIYIYQSFRENTYKPTKEFAYSMCAGLPTGALPKPNFQFFCVHQPSAVESGGGVLVVAGCV